MGRANAAKFSRLEAFGRAYPRLFRRLRQDMASREEALVLYLICKTGFRIGSNDETLADKKAFGASTLRCSHVQVDGNKLAFDFPGKKGVEIKKVLRDALLASAIGGRCGPDDVGIFRTSDESVRAYLNSLPQGKGFLVKDFRTYLATRLALRKIKSMPAPRSQAEFRRFRRQVGEAVAEGLGNTARIALGSYIPPEVFSAWESGHEIEPGKKKGHAVKEFLACVRYDRRVPMAECRDTDPLEKRS
jgi:DNA topoisomerase-1